MPEPPAQTGTEESIAQGAVLYHQHCVFCHGAGLNSDAIIADLRYMSEGSHQAFQQIVRGGILSGIGMASFAERVTEEEADAIHDYVIHASQQKWEEDQATGWWKDLRDWSYEVIADIVNSLGLM